MEGEQGLQGTPHKGLDRLQPTTGALILNGIFWPTNRIIAYPGTQPTYTQSVGLMEIFQKTAKVGTPSSNVDPGGWKPWVANSTWFGWKRARPGTGVGWLLPGRGGPSVLGRRIAWVCFFRSVSSHRRGCLKGVVNLRAGLARQVDTE